MLERLTDNIPFNKALYLKILGPVTAITGLIFAIAVIGFDYQFTTADPFCAPVAIALLTYFFHLAFWNPSDH